MNTGGGASVGAVECPLLPVADQAIAREYLCVALGEVACEQFHIQLAQGYGAVVVKLS